MQSGVVGLKVPARPRCVSRIVAATQLSPGFPRPLREGPRRVDERGSANLLTTWTPS